MFWRVASFTQSTHSPLEAILDRQAPKLEDLLEEDELVQETKALNSRLMEFLKQKDTLQRLIAYAVSPASDSADSKARQKYPAVACEVLCCEVDVLYTRVLEEEDLMRQLFSILDRAPPLDATLAGYFGRVIATMLTRRGREVLEYLQAHQDVLSRMVDHVGTTSVAEVLVRVVGADEQTCTFLTSQQLAWVCDTPVTQQLLDCLDAEHPSDRQEYAAEVLAAIARSRMSPLTRKLSSPEFLQPLVERALTQCQPEAEEASRGTLLQALRICIALLERRRHLESVLLLNSPANTLSQELDSKLETEAVQGIVQHMNRVVTLLDGSNSQRQQPMTWGVLRPPLGQVRLTAVGLVGTLLRTGHVAAEQAVMASGSLVKCMQLFLQYPFNSILHHQVVTIIAMTLETGSDALVRYLFNECKLLAWLAGAPTTVQPAAGGSSAPSSTTAAWRAGYMGHITAMANKLLQVASSREVVASCMRGRQEWQDWCTQTLRRQNELQNIMRWACGRPPVVGANESDSDDLMLHDDLNLDQVSDSLSREAAHRYSAWENDEEEEEEEHAASSFPAAAAHDTAQHFSSPASDATLTSLAMARASPADADEWVPDSWEAAAADRDWLEEGTSHRHLQPSDGNGIDDDVLVITEGGGHELLGDDPVIIDALEQLRLSSSLLDAQPGGQSQGSGAAAPAEAQPADDDEGLAPFKDFTYWRTALPVEIDADA